MLENVTTTLPDVQKHLIDLLPSDAILLGHSLEFDLKALKVGLKGVLCFRKIHTRPMKGNFKFQGGRGPKTFSMESA